MQDYFFSSHLKLIMKDFGCQTKNMGGDSVFQNSQFLLLKSSKATLHQALQIQDTDPEGSSSA